MPSIDFDDPDPKLHGLYIGVITNNRDEEGLGRVRIRIPGLIEPETPWAWPLGMTGGGNADRGLFWVPDQGSEVGVFFKMGDPDHPYYLPANWGAPGGQKETPTASEDGDPDIRVLALGQYDVVIDQRNGSKALRIVDKADTENVIEFDGVTRTVRLSATTGIKLESTGQIDIQGLVVTINGIVAGSGQL